MSPMPAPDFSGEFVDLVQPLFDAGWDFGAYPMAMPDATDFDPPTITGEVGTAASWVDLDVDYSGASALTFGGAQIDLVLDFGIRTEPLAGARQRINAIIDLLDAAYGTDAASAGALWFRTFEALPRPVGKIDEGEWFRKDWRLPVHRHT